MSRKALPMQGKIEKHSVPRLLQGIMDEDRTGCLKVTRDGVERRLYVKEGMVTYASSTEPQDRLGEIFITQGKLTREEVDEVLARSREQGARLGRVLLVEGRITSLDLFRGVTAQVVSIVERMRSWRKGDFSFDEDDEPPSGAVLMRIPLTLYLGGPERKKKPVPLREEEKTAPPPEAAEGDDLLEEEILIEEEEVVIETEPYGEVAFSEEGGEPQGEEGTPVPGRETVAEESGNREPPPVEEKAADESVPEEATDPAVGQAWGEVSFPEDETSEDSGVKETAETHFQLQELRQRRGGDARTLLGVKGDASKEEIREAYHYLASVLHPDRHSPDLAGEDAEEMSELFKDVAAAYEELTADGKMKQAVRSESPFPQSGTRMAAPSGALDPGDEARRQFYKAKEYIAGGNYWQAVDALRQVVRQKPNDASCRNLLGFSLMQTGRRLHEAEEHLKEAIRLDPGNPDFLINLGLVYKSGRSFKKARAIFQQALLYDKNHAMARQELKNLPSEIEWGRESGGFWKKLFGK